MNKTTETRPCTECGASADGPTDSNGQPWCADCYGTGEPT